MTEYKASDKYEKFLRSSIKRLETKLARSAHELRRLESFRVELEQVQQMKKAIPF